MSQTHAGKEKAFGGSISSASESESDRTPKKNSNNKVKIAPPNYMKATVEPSESFDKNSMT